MNISLNLIYLSTLNRIKFDLRCRLGAEILDILMRIKVAAVALREYDPKTAVTRWLLSGLRQKRPNTLPYHMEPEIETQFLDYAVYLTVSAASFHSMFWTMFTLHS